MMWEFVRGFASHEADIFTCADTRLPVAKQRYSMKKEMIVNLSFVYALVAYPNSYSITVSRSRTMSEHLVLGSRQLA